MMCRYDLRYAFNKPGLYITIFTRILFSLFIFIVFSLLTDTVSANVAEANVTQVSNKPDLSKTTHGSVWLLPGDGVYIEALQLETKVDMDVSGMIVRARVKQQFRNVSSLWAEGLYVFPLPENAAVDHFRMMIDGRVIEGQIQEKMQARKTYEKAKSNGQRAGLVEQQRANIFTTKLANISPGAVMTVEIEYQQTLSYRDGHYSLRYPLVVGERYITPSKETASDPVYDTGVYTETSTLSNDINPTSISIKMDAGIPITNIVSTSHQVTISPKDENRYVVTLQVNAVPADRDFLLKWQPGLSTLPKAAVFSQQHDGYDYRLITLYPQENDLYHPVNIPRDVVFILDVSGSMAGTSIEQAKSALMLALERLEPSDRFNIIWFNHEARRVFNDSQQASEDRIDYARKFIRSLNADGGTEMLSALTKAFSTQPDPEYLRQLVFLTDGNVSNERDLFTYIESHLGESRLFTVGIGSAPNSFFMKQAAKAGRGTYTFISDTREVAEKINSLLRKLETPALTDIQVSVSGDDVEYYRNPIPDMYIGEPVTIVLRGKNLSEEISLKGNIGTENWQRTVTLDQDYNNEGVKTAWAREKIASLSESYHNADNEELKTHFKNQIINISYQHHLVSQYTSLVAVDVTPVNQGGMLYQERLKNNRQHGWAAPKKTQTMSAQLNLPQTATPSNWHLMLATVFIILGTLIGVMRVRQ